MVIKTIAQRPGHPRPRSHRASGLSTSSAMTGSSASAASSTPIPDWVEEGRRLRAKAGLRRSPTRAVEETFLLDAQDLRL